MLVSSSDNQALLQVPYAPGEEYVLRATIARAEDNFGGGILIGLVTSKGRCYASIDAWAPKFCHGLELVDGKVVPNNETLREGFLIRDHERREIRCVVRKDSITVHLENQTIINYSGGHHRLSLPLNWTTPDNDALFIGSARGSIKVHQLEVTPITGTGRVLSGFLGKAQSGPVSNAGPVVVLPKHPFLMSVSFSPKGDSLVSGYGKYASPPETGWIGGDIRLWDLDKGKPISTITGHKSLIWAVAFTPDGKTVASASHDYTVKLWNAATGHEVCSFRDDFHGGGTPPHVTCLVFSSDGRQLITGNQRQEVKVWDLATGKLIHVLRGHSGYVWSVAISPDGKLLASAGQAAGNKDPVPGQVKVWDALTGKELYNLTGHRQPAMKVAFGPDSKTLYSASSNGTVKKWDMTTGLNSLTFQAHDRQLKAFAVSPDGQRLATAGEDHDAKLIKIWDALRGQVLYSLLGHADIVSTLAFSPDGKRLASGDYGGTLNVWDVTAGTSDAPASRPPPGKESERGWKSLFNSKDTRGWERDGFAVWKVENGELVAQGEGGKLLTLRNDYTDFHFRIEALIKGHYAVQQFRLQPKKGNRAYKAVVGGESEEPGDFIPGTLFIRPGTDVLAKAKGIQLKQDEWLTQEVIAVGNHIVVKVNGQSVVDFVDKEMNYTKGHLALRCFANSVSRFRKIEVKELSPSQPATSP